MKLWKRSALLLALLAAFVLVVGCTPSGSGTQSDAGSTEAGSSSGSTQQDESSGDESSSDASSDDESTGSGNATTALSGSLQDQADEAGGSEGSSTTDSSSSDQEETDSTSFVPDGLKREEAPSRAIIGTDDRVDVSDPSVYPYSAVAYMIVHYPCGHSATGTGFMVGEDVLLTAAHCVVCTEHNQPADDLDFYFGYNEADGSYVDHYNQRCYYYYGTSFPGGYTHSNMEWDFAVVKLTDEKVGLKTGYFGYRSGLPASSLYGSAYQLIGYRDGDVKTSWGVASQESDETPIRLFYHDADTLNGYSGGPIFDDGYYVVGINIAHNDKPANVGHTISNDVYTRMLELSMPTQEGD